MKNKGYTLIELLGVMILLALLITVVFPSVINFIKSSNDKKDKLTRDLVYNAAEMFIEDNASEFYFNNGSKYCIPIDTLIKNNYLKGDLEYQGEVLDKTKSVRLTYTDKFNYEITDKDECAVCKLVNDADSSNSITPGDKYQCKVKDNMEKEFQDGYYFYVLSQDNNLTTNLIMDRNICDDGTVATEEKNCLVAWYSEVDNTQGPVTAMNYLNNATSTWSNISNSTIIYNDEGGNFKNFKMISKARLPYRDELSDYDETNGYLYDYLYAACYDNEVDLNFVDCSEAGYIKDSVHEDGFKHIKNVEGYWTFSSYEGNTKSAWLVKNWGMVGHGIVNYSYSYFVGVRPVITISNSLLSN